MADPCEGPPLKPPLVEVTTTTAEVKELSSSDVKLKLESADTGTGDGDAEQKKTPGQNGVDIDGIVLKPEMEYFIVPDEMWWQISDSLGHQDMKNLRIIHPCLYGAYKGYKRFYDTSVVQFKNQKSSIFDNLMKSTYTWAAIGLEILNGVFKDRVSEDFYDRYSERITSISFLNCNVNIPNETGSNRQYYLAEIIGRCRNLISLEVGATPHILPPTVDENIIVSDQVVWPSIKKVKFVRDSKFPNDLALYVLTRVKDLEELTIQGSSLESPGTKSLAKNVTKKQEERWTADAEFIINFIMPFIIRDAGTLKKLSLQYFYLLASNALFVPSLVDIYPPPELEELDLTMCSLTPKQFSTLSYRLKKLTRISCSLVPTRKCKHRPYEVNYFPAPPLPAKPKLLYKTPASARQIGQLTQLNISNSVSLDCLCFIGQMKNLLHLDCSYCPSIRNKQTLLNGNGPAFGPYKISKKKLAKEQQKLEEERAKQQELEFVYESDEDKKKTERKQVIWKIKTFKFAGNMGAKLDVKRFILFNLVHLDLSFSDCVRENKDFTHICAHFRKLEVLKLSGSSGEFRLNRLKTLKRLIELRLRSCRKIAPEQFETNISLPLLKILDIGDTQVKIEGIKNIVEKNRLLVTLDFRGCENVQIEGQDFQDFAPLAQHVSLRFGILPPKRKTMEKKGKENLAESLGKLDLNPKDTSEVAVKIKKTDSSAGDTVETLGKVDVNLEDTSELAVKIEKSDSSAGDTAEIKSPSTIEVKSEKSPQEI